MSIVSGGKKICRLGFLEFSDSRAVVVLSKEAVVAQPSLSLASLSLGNMDDVDEILNVVYRVDGCMHAQTQLFGLRCQGSVIF